jgi:predicted nucleic acid-binding protein
LARLIVLDSGPLGLAIRKPGKPLIDRLHAWVRNMLAGGSRLAVTEIAHYEVRRELVRLNAISSLHRLDRLVSGRAGMDYLPLTTEVIVRAAEYWAVVRRAGQPTADPKELDGDAILAAQASLAGNPGDEVLIATTNAGHLARFPGISAQSWEQIR